MNSGFSYKEYSEWAKKVNITNNEFKTWLKKFIYQQAQRVVEKGKPRTPVDTGFLRNSWYIKSAEIVGDTILVRIGLSAEYASYIEYGHHSYEGRYMLTISLDEVQRQLPARFNEEWRKFLKSKGVI